MDTTGIFIIIALMVGVVITLVAIALLIMRREPALETRSDRQQGTYIGTGISIGAGIGVAIGLVLGNIALGIAIGVALGVAIGTALEANNRPIHERPAGEPRWVFVMAMTVLLLGVIAFIAILLVIR